MVPFYPSSLCLPPFVFLSEADGPRTIVSGLVKYQTEEELLGREVVVLANLKPRALKGTR